MEIVPYIAALLGFGAVILAILIVVRQYKRLHRDLTVFNLLSHRQRDLILLIRNMRSVSAEQLAISGGYKDKGYDIQPDLDLLVQLGWIARRESANESELPRYIPVRNAPQPVDLSTANGRKPR